MWDDEQLDSYPKRFYEYVNRRPKMVTTYMLGIRQPVVDNHVLQNQWIKDLCVPHHAITLIWPLNHSIFGNADDVRDWARVLDTLSKRIVDVETNGSHCLLQFVPIYPEYYDTAAAREAYGELQDKIRDASSCNGKIVLHDPVPFGQDEQTSDEPKAPLLHLAGICTPYLMMKARLVHFDDYTVLTESGVEPAADIFDVEFLRVHLESSSVGCPPKMSNIERNQWRQIHDYDHNNLDHLRTVVRDATDKVPGYIKEKN
ncbi:MAG: hypothetical protein ACRDD1_05155 [Planctomycetia bacterium]